MNRIIPLMFFSIFMQINALSENLITGITITMPVSPDPNTATWGTGSVFAIMASTTERNLKEAINTSILVTIKKGDGKVCGSYTNLNAPASNFSRLTMSWSGKSAVSLMGQECNLPPGDYKLCVQFFLKGQMVSEEVCKTFIIKAPENITYQPPQGIAPADGTVINEADAKKPVTFRWIPVTPKPRDAVTYKLRIFEVKQGQTATAVVKNANPLHEKDIINQTQYVLSSLSQLNANKGSGFAWTVQALGPKGNPVGGNNGMSNICTITLDIGAIQLLGFQVNCSDTQGLFNFTFSVQNNSTDIFEITSISFNPIVTGTIISPSLSPSQTIPVNGSLSFNGTFNYTGVIPNPIVISLSGNQSDLPALTSARDTVPPCICTDCDSVNIEYVDTSYTKVNNNTYNLTGTLDVNIPIYGVEFQVVSWEYTATPPSCTNGVNSLEQSAMLLLPSTTINGNVPVACDISIPGNNANAVKCVRYLSSTPITDPLFNLTLGLPGALPGLPINCCAIKYKVCVKAIVFLDAEHCNYCSYIDCFEFDNH